MNTPVSEMSKNLHSHHKDEDTWTTGKQDASRAFTDPLTESR